MRHTNRELKVMARRALTGNFTIVIAAQLLLFLGNFLINILLARVFQGEGSMTTVMYETCGFVTTLIMNVVSAGVYLIFLRVSRGEEYSLMDMLYFFRSNPDRVIIAGFFVSGITTLINLPFRYAFQQIPENVYADMGWLVQFWVSALTIELIQLAMMLFFALVYWLICDDETLGGWEAVRKSYRLMKGNKRRFLRLLLSFFPMLILSLFSFGIGFLIMMPLVRETEAFFYRDVIGDL